MSNQPKRPRPPVILVFGESPNDTTAIGELVHALRPDAPRFETRRKPLVLVKGRAVAEQRKNATDIGSVVRADEVLRDVRHVFAHQDADAVESAHEAIATEIEARLAGAGVSAVAAVPAWEIEAWWYQWPKALAQVNPGWRAPGRLGKEVGKVEHAKEALTRDLRPKGKHSPTRDYEESDAPRVAEKVRVLGIVDEREATSGSFNRFAERVRAAKL